MNLSGKTILVTRSRHQAGESVHAIERAGGNAVIFSTIEITPPQSWDACDKALKLLPGYHGICFGSTNGVEFFFRRAAETAIPTDCLRDKQIYAVGEKTKEAVEHHDLPVTVIPDSYSASELVASLRKEAISGKKFLLPKGNLGDNTLSKGLEELGGIVDSIEVYQTVKPDVADAEKMYARIVTGEIDVLTFASPSAVRNFLSLFSVEKVQNMYSHSLFAVIGPVTAEALRQNGFSPHVTARHSTIHGLIEAIIHHFQPEFENPEKL
jgi:uroporphyrinogen-III synthase